MIHGLSNGEFLDDQKFWPIYERAEKLDVPIYFHPSVPHPAVMEAYYKDYVKDFPMVIRAAWGFTVETATQALRMVLSGVFDKHPNLKIIIGHLGETLPFLVWRVDNALARPGGKSMSFRDIFCNHFYITTSGNFSNPALLVLRAGDGHRPHPVRDRLAVRAEQARHRLDPAHPAVRGGQGQALERQRQAAAAALTRDSVERPESLGGTVGVRRRVRRKGVARCRYAAHHPLRLAGPLAFGLHRFLHLGFIRDRGDIAARFGGLVGGRYAADLLHVRCDGRLLGDGRGRSRCRFDRRGGCGHGLRQWRRRSSRAPAARCRAATADRSLRARPPCRHRRPAAAGLQVAQQA